MRKLTKVLITVKTYPTLSAKYDELVCTAGFTEEGKFIRIYPIPFRKIDFENRYSKYQWIEVELEKNKSDSRPESYKPVRFPVKINVLDKINTADNWSLRKKICLQKVYSDLSLLIKEAKNPNITTSLAVFKPCKILQFICKPVDREWDSKKLEKIRSSREQLSLFEQHIEDPFEVVNKLPYKFSYKIEDEKGKISTMMIEDWEIGALYWRTLKDNGGSESIAIEKVRQKYYDDFAKKKDIHLYLGTTKLHHYTAKNPFVIIGTFTPKFEHQLKLF
ncbi:hypothetical protein [Flammeovirga aprica]|uniref:Uncharacterized protein n=1 Tax=Flammeovirga aprica JL-4 TaxID=694437 RepID=A0A7X9RUN0_9BACT|nr:hypothetical protein [Flammeovirga aprica]NME69022.1 hypothetical protein [Flammeovirga aprica JL-4]